ncbi:MAG: hypothetical protein CMO34_00575, partial [Verrucomicrobia bacterium]|nr:hypothetical protein [Verrucomicrobiota bacterium]
MKKTKHLLFFSPGFPVNESDTRCIPAMQLFMNALNQTETVEISVISLHYPYKEKKYKWNGINVCALGGNNEKGLKRILLVKRAFREAKKIHKSKPVDHVHSFWLGECAWLGNKIAKSISVPHSCTLMGQDALSSNNYWKKIKPLPQLISLSRFQEDALKKHQPNAKTLRIYWGVEQEMTPLTEKSIDIIGAGWINKVKHYERFVNIVDKLSLEVKSLSCELVGEGEQFNELRNLIQERKLENVIKLSGGVNREISLEKIKKARVFLHTSAYESFGLVFVEAMALGTKVFSTAVGIAPEVEEISCFDSD